MAITKVSEFVIDNNTIGVEKLKVIPGTNGQVLAIDSSYNLYFTDLVSPESIDDRVAALINSGTHTNITIVYDDIAGSLSFIATGSVTSVNSQTGDVVLVTDNISEGSGNLYFTNTRARNAISVTDNGGDGSLSYNSSTGMITYTGPSPSEVRSHFTGGTGVSIIDGEISIGQDVSTTSNVEFNNITSTGNIQVDGNLIVGGSTTTLTATNLAISDNMVYLNQAIATTITDVVGDGSSVVYTTLEDHNYLIGYSVTISDVIPSVYNLSNQTITNVSTNTFTISNSATDAYVSGGTARGRSNANPDLGFAFGYYDTSYQHGGFFRDASDGIFKIFKGYTPEPDESPYINTSHPTFALADFQVNALYGNVIGNVTGTVSSISNHSTTDLTEGTNLYYTDERARNAISASGDLSYNSSTGVLSVTTYKTSNFNTDFSNKTTTDLTEGTNLYFTNARARNAISASGDLSYNPTTGILSVTTYKTVNFNADFSNKTTTDLTEGTNLYYTDERVDDRVSNLVVAGSNINVVYDDNANTLTISANSMGGYDLTNNTTDDLAEGLNNLYYTDQRVTDWLAQYIVINDTSEFGGLSYNSLTGVIDHSGITTSEILSKFSAANGITYNSSNGSIGLDSSASVEFVDLILTGNLVVNGTTTSINTVEMQVSDNIITLNSDLTALTPPTENAGIEVNRGIEHNVGIRWNETTDKWQFTNNGIVYQDIGSLASSNTDDLSEGTINLYYTDSRVDTRVNILRTDLETSGNSSVHFDNLTNVPVIVKDVFTGNGTQTDFTLSATPGSPEALIVTMNGVTQTPGGDYTVSGTIISFVNPLPDSQVAIVRHVGYQVVGGITGNYLNISGGIMSGSIFVDADNTYDLGTTTNQWRAVYGRTIEATYADLAERYEADAEYEIGTVVVFGGDKEITTTDNDEDVSVAGVISGNPAFRMNAQAGNDLTHPYVALRGRVPCKVIGPVKKGDLLTTSNVAGYAKSVGKTNKGVAIFAKSLQEDLSDNQKIIEVVIV